MNKLKAHPDVTRVTFVFHCIQGHFRVPFYLGRLLCFAQTWVTFVFRIPRCTLVSHFIWAQWCSVLSRATLVLRTISGQFC